MKQGTPSCKTDATRRSLPKFAKLTSPAYFTAGWKLLMAIAMKMLPNAFQNEFGNVDGFLNTFGAAYETERRHFRANCFTSAGA
jgi:hypothetical protein